MTPAPPRPADATALDTEFTRGLGLYDSTMVVIGSMVGSGIFIVSADMSRTIGSPGWMLAAWVLTGLLTISGALSYGELAAMMPRAGGQYVYLREAFSPLWGFLYGWTLFMVIQTGTVAAVAVAFARLRARAVGVRRALPRGARASQHRLCALAVDGATHRHRAHCAAHLVEHAGLEYGRRIQNVFTTAKGGALAALILAGLFAGWNADAVADNFGRLWETRGQADVVPGLSAVTAMGLFVAICVSQTGSLFSSDAWTHHLHRRRGEGSETHAAAVAGDRHWHGDRAVPAGEPGLPGDAPLRGDPACAIGPCSNTGN